MIKQLIAIKGPDQSIPLRMLLLIVLLATTDTVIANNNPGSTEQAVDFGPNQIEPVMLKLNTSPMALYKKQPVALVFWPQHCKHCQSQAVITPDTAIVDATGATVNPGALNTVRTYTAQSLSFLDGSDTHLSHLVLLLD